MGDEVLLPDNCSVCGRTILAGERTHQYLTRDGEPRAVCDLCRARAEAAGWLPADVAANDLPEREAQGRGRGRMRRLLERAREGAAAIAVREAAAEPREQAEDGGGDGAREEPPPASQPPRRPARAAEEGNGAAAAQRPSRAREELAEVPRRRRSVPQKPERRIRYAFDAFNASEHPRTVAGLIRSLGLPRVGAVAGSASPALVKITVAWELSWYQWEVDLADDDLAVRELAKGTELDEIAEEERDWNAHCTEDGELRLGAEGQAGG